MTLVRLFQGVCPVCQQASIFKGLLSFVDHCPVCTTPIASQDIGDGPAYLSICLASIVVVSFVLWLEFTSQPPLIFYVFMVPLVTIGISILALRLTRSWFLIIEQRHHPELFKHDKT